MTYRASIAHREMKRNEDKRTNRYICHPNHCLPITSHKLYYGLIPQQVCDRYHVNTKDNVLPNNSNGGRPQFICIQISDYILECFLIAI